MLKFLTAPAFKQYFSQTCTGPEIQVHGRASLNLPPAPQIQSETRQCMTLASWAIGTPSGRAGWGHRAAALSAGGPQQILLWDHCHFHERRCYPSGGVGCHFFPQADIPAFPLSKGLNKASQPEPYSPVQTPFHIPNPPEQVGLPFQSPHLDMLPALPKPTLAVLSALLWLFFPPALQNSDESELAPPLSQVPPHPPSSLQMIPGQLLSTGMKPAHFRAPALRNYFTCSSLGALPLQGPFPSCSWD